YVAPAVHVLFFKDELKRARKRIGMRVYFRPNSPPVCARPFRFVKKEQHNGVVTISQVPRLLRIMTVNVIHIAIEVLGDACDLIDDDGRLVLVIADIDVLGTSKPGLIVKQDFAGRTWVEHGVDVREVHVARDRIYHYRLSGGVRRSRSVAGEG